MKTIKSTLIAFLAITTLALQSCSKDDSENEGSSDTYVRFTLDGTDYDFKDIASATSLSLTLTGTEGDIDSGEYSSLGIFLPLAPTEGTYDVTDFFGSGDHKITLTSESLDINFSFAESGSITITSASGEFIEGTFSGIVTSDNVDFTITNGSFKGYNID